MPCSAINQHINVWKGKIILRIDLVKIPKIDTNPNLVVLLKNGNKISQPLRILDHR